MASYGPEIVTHRTRKASSDLILDAMQSYINVRQWKRRHGMSLRGTCVLYHCLAECSTHHCFTGDIRVKCSFDRMIEDIRLPSYFSEVPGRAN
eukprot:2600975-Amphidinium_carterae.1